MNFLIHILSVKKSNLFELSDLNITLKIRGTGYKNIFSSEEEYEFESEYYPDKISINGIDQDIINHTYFFDSEENIVDLIWYNSIKNCRQMFRKSHDITEINLFYFDSSQIETMYCMFFECTSLTSVNLTNFETSKVTEMG